MDARRLPLNAVRAFEAAARHQSLSRAAAELGVTPGAIGHQLRVLGAHLGTPLFRKAGTGVALTEAGQRALPQVQAAFTLLAGAFDGGAEDRLARQVTVAVHPSFAAGWLVPRLDAFAARHPALDVRVVAPADAEAVIAGQADVVLTYRAERRRGLLLRPLLGETMLPVATPAFLAKNPLQTAAELLRQPLLHSERAADDHVYPRWEEWLAAAGVTLPGRLRGPRFALTLLALQAARDGQGVALVSSALVQGDLAAGRLATPRGDFPVLAIQRYLLARRAQDQRLAVRAFLRWLQAEGQR